MTLMKDLVNLQKPELAEERKYSNPEYARFKKIFELIERDLEHLDSVTKAGSNTEKLVEKLGGDASYLKTAREALDTLDAAMMDLHMSVGMAVERGDE
jgi:peptidase E